MQTDIHLSFPGTCDEAFTFYESVFHTKRTFSMTWGEAPPDFKCAPEMQQKIMHTAMRIGSMTLMGSDSPPERAGKFAAFDISLSGDEQEIRRLYDALQQDGGSSEMPLGPTFWTSLFGMCRDRFGVDWMLSVPGPEPA